MIHWKMQRSYQGLRLSSFELTMVLIEFQSCPASITPCDGENFGLAGTKGGESNDVQGLGQDASRDG